jgi:hypothetical protein
MMTGRSMPPDLVHLVRPDDPGGGAGIPARLSSGSMPEGVGRAAACA